MVRAVGRKKYRDYSYGDRREGVPLLTPGEVLHHMALRMRQGE